MQKLNIEVLHFRFPLPLANRYKGRRRVLVKARFVNLLINIAEADVSPDDGSRAFLKVNLRDIFEGVLLNFVLSACLRLIVFSEPPMMVFL